MKTVIWTIAACVVFLSAPTEALAETETMLAPAKIELSIASDKRNNALRNMRQAIPKLNGKAPPQSTGLGTDGKDPKLFTKVRIHVLNDARMSGQRIQPAMLKAICTQAIQITATDSEGGIHGFDGQYTPYRDGLRAADLSGFATQVTEDIFGDDVCSARISLPNDEDLKVEVHLRAKDGIIFIDAGALGTTPIKLREAGVDVAPKARTVRLTSADYGVRSVYFDIQQLVR